MPDYGVTAAGFVPKRLADVLASVKSKLNAITVNGQTLVVNDGDDTVIAQMMGIVSAEVAEAWEAMSVLSTQFDPRYNTGAAQSGVVQINGILRRAAIPTQISVDMTGTVGKNVLAGAVVTDVDGTMSFSLNDMVTFNGAGEATGVFTSNSTTAVSINDGATLKIATPTTGWKTAVVNTTVVAGSSEETDEELRIRQQNSTALTSKSQFESIYAAVLNVTGVKYGRVYANSTVTDESTGKLIPAKSIAVVVLGGSDEDVATAIFNASPVGIGFFGTTTVDIVDPTTGFSYEVSFVRPTEIAVDVDVTVHGNGTDFQVDTYEADIKNAIIAYAEGGAGSIGVQTGFDRDGILPGEYVHVSSLYTPCNSIPGQYVVSLEIGEHGGSMGTTDVVIEWDEIATFDAANITVTLDT